MKASNLVLLCSLPLIPLLVPVLQKKASWLVAPSIDISAYEGDCILAADTSSYHYVWWWWPSVFTTRWTITQRPVFGDAHHEVSFYVAAKSNAHHFLYRLDSDYTSDYFFVEGDYRQVFKGHQHLDLRRNIYILPKEYSPGKEAKADYVLEVKKETLSLEKNKTYGYCLYQFQNRQDYKSFIDLNPGAIDSATGCHCSWENFPPYNDTDSSSGVLPSYYCAQNSPGPYFTSSQSSYNFFSPVVPTNSFVKFTANITMYFYDELKLRKYTQYKCTIEDEDICSFTLPKPSIIFYEPQLILACVHPHAGPSSLTTTINIQTDVMLTENLARSTLYLVTPIFLVKFFI